MFVERLSSWLIQWRWPLLLLAIVFTIVAWPFSRRLEFDRSIDNLFAPDDPLVAPYLQLKRTFGGDEIVLAAYIDPDALSKPGLARLDDLATKLGQVEGVSATFAITAKLPLGITILGSPMRERFLELCEGYTIGADRQTVGIACLLEPPGKGKVSKGSTVNRLRELTEAHDPTGVVTGEPVIVVDGFQHLEQDGRQLGVASSVLLMAVIIFCFRSLRWVLIPAVVTAATLIWTRGLIVGLGMRMSMVSSMLWSLVTVICVATVVHVIVAFRGARQQGLDSIKALAVAGTLVAAPVFWSCLTDAAGFGSLIISRVGPVQDFGIMMAASAMIALVAIAMFVPGLALIGGFDTDPRRAWGEGGLERVLGGISWAIDSYPKTLALVIAAISVPLSFGVMRMEVETDYTKNFREGSPVVKSYEFVESRLGGAGTLDVVVPIADEPDPELFDRLRRLTERLRDEVKLSDGSEGITKAMSVVDVIDVVAPGADLGPEQLGDTLGPARRIVPLIGGLYGHDPDTGREHLRIMLRALERQPAQEKQRLIEQVRGIAREEFPDAKVTGMFVLLASLVDSLIRDQWLMFGLATAGIGAMMLVAFRSLKLALIGLVPNALPITMLMGSLGWLDIRVNMGTAMIAAVSMGLAVDASMHYILGFQRHLAVGETVTQALHAIHQTVGRAMVFSTLALMMGFSALALSEFVPTIYFGILASLSMLGGMLGNLVMLPLLLTLTCKRDEPAAKLG